MSHSIPNEPLPSKPYDDEYVFKVPSMRFEAYKDGEFEHDERLLLTALTGRYKLKADGFHRLLAKFIMHLNGFSTSRPFEKVEIEVPPFASEFKTAGELSNQIELNEVFYDDLIEDQLLEKLPFDREKMYQLRTESDFQRVKSWLFAAISSLLIRSRIRNPKKQKAKYKELFKKLPAISYPSSESLLNMNQTPFKIAINFNKFERIMKQESDALRFAICWMVLVLENYPRSNATDLFKFCFLNSARNHGLVLFVHWDQMGYNAPAKLKWRRLDKIAENVHGVGKSIENLERFFGELPTKADKDGKPMVFSLRWRYCRLIHSEFFSYLGISANLKAFLVLLFAQDHFILYSNKNQYFEFVKSRENRPGFQKLTEEEEEFLKKDVEYFRNKLNKNSVKVSFFSSVAEAEEYERWEAKYREENPDSGSEYDY